MGNNVVIPSVGNWYTDPLKRMKIRVKDTIESSTFFLTLDCLDESNNPLIVKAYEYTKSLMPFPIVGYSKIYFNQLNNWTQDLDTDLICGFDPIKIIDRCVFMVRPKFEYTLSQRLSDYPLPEEIEKRWISYQLMLAIQSFHEAKIVHGNLHPDNVFLTWDLRLTIGDPAPYKPAQIRFNHPQTFIHFFGSSNTHCYLSPRRLIMDENSPIINEFNDLDNSDDIFSYGCIIYYIYTQKHLFSLSSIGDYINGKFDIVEKLSEIPEDIRELVEKCVSLSPEERIEAFTNQKQSFPVYFQQFFYQIEEFFHNHIQLDNLIFMIPTFEEFLKIGGNDVRVILSNILAQFLLKSDDLHSKVKFSSFFVNMCTELPDNIIFTRVLPSVVGLLSPESSLLTKTVFNCLEILLDNVHEVPQYLSLIFQNYLITSISKLSEKATPNVRCVVCEFFPRLLKLTTRLESGSESYCIKTMTFMMKEDNEMVLACFIKSFSAVVLSYDKTLSFISIYPLLFSCMNSPNERFRTRILEVFRKWHPFLANDEKKIFRKMINSIFSAALNFGTGDALTGVLEFIIWGVSSKIVDSAYFPDIYNFLMPHLNSSSPIVRYMINQLSKMLPEEFSQAILPVFVLNSLNRRKSHFQKSEDVLNNQILIGKCKLANFSQINLHPKFLSSHKVSTFGITAIAPMYNSKYDIAAADKSGKIFCVSNSSENEIEKLFNIDRGVTSMISYESSSSSLLSISNNFASIEWNSLRLNLLPYKLNTPILSVHHIFNDDCFYSINKDSTATFFDKRSQKLINTVKFNDFSLISSCVWSGGSQTVGFGFNEGNVSLFDSRTFTPFKSFNTVQAKCIAPIYTEGEEKGAFFVGGSGGGEVFTFSSSCPFLETAFEVQNCVHYKGSTLFFTQNAAVLLTLHPLLKSYVVNDKSYQALKFSDEEQENKNLNKNKDNKNMKLKENKILMCNYIGKPPLLCHTVPITCVCEAKSGFSSGDSNGSINFWSIERT